MSEDEETELNGIMKELREVILKLSKNIRTAVKSLEEALEVLEGPAWRWSTAKEELENEEQETVE